MKIELDEIELDAIKKLLLSESIPEKTGVDVRQALIKKFYNNKDVEEYIVENHNEIYNLTTQHLDYDFDSFELYDFYMMRDSILKLLNQLDEYNEMLDFAQLQIFPNYDLSCNLIWESRNKTIH